MDAAASAASPIRRIVVRGVGRTFGNTAALRGVDCSFEAGDVTTLEGPNGSGKSTLVGILGTLVAPTTGQVLFEPAPEDRTALRAEIGWVAHHSFAYPDLSTEENVRFAAKAYGVDDERAWQNALERFDLGAFADRPVRLQSRGQKQRVALARALVHAPSIVLLDEPTAGLDAASTERLVGTIRELAEADCIVVVVTHDPAFVDAVATRRIRLQKGRVVGESRIAPRHAPSGAPAEAGA